MAKDLGSKIVNFLWEHSKTSSGQVKIGELAVQLRSSESDIRDELLLLEIEGLVREVSQIGGGSSGYDITQLGEAYAMRNSKSR